MLGNQRGSEAQPLSLDEGCRTLLPLPARLTQGPALLISVLGRFDLFLPH